MPNERFRQMCRYESEGAAAAAEGKTREDCPYNKEVESEAWNFWVYGNENEQGSMVRAFMAGEGEPTFYMTTAELTPATAKLLQEWGEKVDDATRRFRSARGWKLPK
jgi:ribosome modulation factor